MTESDWLERAVALALRNVEAGGRPFGSVIVKDGALVAEGVNLTEQEGDPTAHAELVALREAAKKLGGPRLAGCIVYASGEPCPMCQAACLLAGVERIVYAAEEPQAARVGFPVAWMLTELCGPAGARKTPFVRGSVADADAPFEAWSRRKGP
ncbi:nucleoside deaminase [Myxococcaceae bacterium GXIMD 01537]